MAGFLIAPEWDGGRVNGQSTPIAALRQPRYPVEADHDMSLRQRIGKLPGASDRGSRWWRATRSMWLICFHTL
jgi:hypothetical protein